MNDIKKILLKMLLFTPLIIYTGIPLSIFFIGKENYSIEMVYQVQKKDASILFGHGYSDKRVAYKFFTTLQKKPKILILGTSRVMQLQPEDFSSDCYNAGGGVAKITQVLYFLEGLKQKNYLPKTLIVGFDQYFFNKNWDQIFEEKTMTFSYLTELNNSGKKNNFSLKTGNRIFVDLLKKKICIKKMINSKEIGINAQMNSNGFKENGMYFYGYYYLDKQSGDKNFKEAFSRIDTGTNIFEYADTINPKALDVVNTLLTFCSTNNIKVIGFLPPYAPSVWEKMKNSKNYTYIELIYPEMKKMFSEYGASFYDFSYMPETVDSQYIDGYHGSDTVYEIIQKEIWK